MRQYRSKFLQHIMEGKIEGDEDPDADSALHTKLDRRELKRFTEEDPMID